MNSDLRVRVDIHRPGPIRMGAQEEHFLRLALNLAETLESAERNNTFNTFAQQVLILLDAYRPNVLPGLPLAVRKNFIYVLRTVSGDKMLRESAQKLLNEFEASILDEIREQRERLLKKDLPPADLAQWLKGHHSRNEFEFAFDAADHYFDALLEYEPPGFDVARVGEEGLCFQPTPVSLIVRWIEEHPPQPSDIIYDLGSGTGRTVAALALLSPSQVYGIEISADLADKAKRLVTNNNIPRCSFIQGDIRTTDFSSGNIFYLFNPFAGNLLELVLERLKRLAECKKISIVAMGECRTRINRCTWLQQQTAANDNLLTIGRYKSL